MALTRCEPPPPPRRSKIEDADWLRVPFTDPDPTGRLAVARDWRENRPVASSREDAERQLEQLAALEAAGKGGIELEQRRAELHDEMAHGTSRVAVWLGLRAKQGMHLGSCDNLTAQVTAEWTRVAEHERSRERALRAIFASADCARADPGEICSSQGHELGLALESRGDASGAIDIYREVVRRWPRARAASYARLGLGLVFLAQEGPPEERLTEAAGLLEQVASDDQASADLRGFAAHLAASLHHRGGEPARALALLEPGLRSSSDEAAWQDYVALSAAVHPVAKAVANVRELAQPSQERRRLEQLRAAYLAAGSADEAALVP